ncbi:phage tail fiber protein [Enterobacter sp. Z1]|nr:phage tail fiber protein [Enterobacter sp. Z1]
MSVPNQTPYIIYNANGLTTVFPFEFYIINAGDIQVSINGTVVTSGYSVSGVGNVGGGDVTFITPPASGSVVMLERVVPTYRLTDYQDNGDLLADTVNKDFDRLWMAIQRSFIYLGLALRRPLLGGPYDAEGYRISELADPVDAQDAATKNYVDNVSLVRTLRVPESVVSILPPADQRANKLLAFNALGQPITVVPQSGSASDVLIELAKPTGASHIGVQPQGNLAQMRPHITPEMFGAVGDGVTDDTIAIRAAFQAGSDLKIAVWGSGKTYGVTSTLWMQVNQPEIAYMNVDVIRPTASGELSELFSYKTASAARITVDFHHVYVTTNKKARQVIVLDGTRRCKVHDCTFLDVDTPECYGIRLGISNNGYDNLYNDIYNNYITVGTDPDGGVGTVTRNGIVAFSNYADPVVGQTGGPDWAAYPPSVQYTRIFNNTVIGGTHNLHIRGCNVVDIFDNTLVGGSHRNINLSRMCQRIHIHDNMLLNAGSAAVVFGYCRWIKITDNYIYSGVVTAQGR